MTLVSVQEHPEEYLMQPQLCREEAADCVLYELARACHGTLWRRTAGSSAVDYAVKNETEYDEGVATLDGFAPGWSESDEPVLPLAVASMLHAIDVFKQNYEEHANFEDVIAVTFDGVGFEATRAVDFSCHCFRESLGKFPAWHLRATTGFAVAAIASELMKLAQTKVLVQEGLAEDLTKWLEDNVCSSSSGSPISSAAMQVVSSAVTGLAAYLAREQETSVTANRARTLA